MIIHDGKTAIHVRVLQGAYTTEAPRSAGDLEEFFRWWKMRAADYRCPRPALDGSDRRLAASLLNQHGLDRVKAVGVVFWRRHAEALVSGQYQRHMILFKSKFSLAEQDLDGLQQTSIG